MKKNGISLDLKGMEKLERMLKQKLPKIKVGILGPKDARKDDDAAGSNASIGLIHEFGTEHMPQRSFLRFPLTEKFHEYLEKSWLLNKKDLDAAIKEGGFTKIYKKVGVIAETVIIDAFDSGGFGKWEPSNMKNKKNHQTLVETQQLRNSITSEVESDS
jgi:phage gpG-like protein